MTENIMDSILGIELSRLTIDGPEPSNYIMIQTKRRKYAFKLSESETEKAYNVFKLFVFYCLEQSDRITLCINVHAKGGWLFW